MNRNSPVPTIDENRMKQLVTVVQKLFKDPEYMNLGKQLFMLLDKVDVSLILYVAEQFNMLNDLDEVKDAERYFFRRLLKAKIQTSPYKGTKYAIEEVLKAFNLKARVVEWFEYGGTPFTFYVAIEECAYERDAPTVIPPEDSTEYKQIMNDTEYRIFMHLVKVFKNARSTFIMDVENAPGIYAGTCTDEVVHFRDLTYADNIEAEGAHEFDCEGGRYLFFARKVPSPDHSEPELAFYSPGFYYLPTKIPDRPRITGWIKQPCIQEGNSCYEIYRSRQKLHGRSVRVEIATT